MKCTCMAAAVQLGRAIVLLESRIQRLDFAYKNVQLQSREFSSLKFYSLL